MAIQNIEFWNRVTVTDSCWTYPEATYNGIPTGILVWKEVYGEIADHRLLRACDQPLCVRPSHLYLINKADQFYLDWKQRKGRPGQYRLSEKQVVLIHSMNGILKMQQIKDLFGLTSRQVHEVLSSRDWNHVRSIMKRWGSG